MNYNLKIIKSNRKTISLEVTKDLEVLLRIPLSISKKESLSIIEKNQTWINNKIFLLEEKKLLEKEFAFTNNHKALFFGNSYLIKVIESEEAFLFSEDIFFVSDKVENIFYEFSKFYQNQLNIYIEKRLIYFAKLMNLKYNRFALTNAKKRWGSCNSKGNLCFSIRLICLEKNLIDYVIVHELCHLKVPNHSRNFYNLIEKYLPDYKNLTKKLHSSITF